MVGNVAGRTCACQPAVVGAQAVSGGGNASLLGRGRVTVGPLVWLSAGGGAG